MPVENSKDNRPYVWQMVREAVEALGGQTTNVAVRDWILQRYPNTNPATIQCQVILCTVNHRSRIHYAENNKPRRAETQYDFLFRPARGQVELYDPQRHGLWEIFERQDGRLDVRMTDTDVTSGPPTDEDAEGSYGSAFAAEGHLRDYLAQHLEQVEPGLQLYVDDEEKTGVEYATPIGRIDILAVDEEDGFVVIELKVSRGPDSVAGQVLRYKNWVQSHLADNERVRGVIIARNISEKVQYAILSDPDITTMEYELSLELRPVKGPPQ